jgi:hypothetical protein|tara:strand:- start:887 stop:1069 length:183 start_codon:yes stop_codon:yes gene_type:complete
MSCKKSELVSAINSYCSARTTNDPNLVRFSAQLINQLLDTIEFEPEEDSAAEEKANDDQS